MASAAAAIGLLTTLSGVFIELASDLLADLRDGVCVERLPGDTRPLWQATLGGGWRPFDRVRCCGGLSSVDHATEECRALSIIQRSSHKQFAYPLPAVAFGGPSGFGAGPAPPGVHLGRTGRAGRVGHAATVLGQLDASSEGAVPWAPWLLPLERGGFGDGGFGDPAEGRAAGVSRGPLAHRSSLAVASEVAVNAGAVQTQSESAGSLAPTYVWVPWERVLPRGTGALWIYVAGSGCLALLAGLVTWRHPAASGSGIPEVRARVVGFAVPQAFQAQTLAAKVLALSLCVGAGLAVGKEGPMIHIGACWGALLAAPVAGLGRAGGRKAKAGEGEGAEGVSAGAAGAPGVAEGVAADGPEGPEGAGTGAVEVDLICAGAAAGMAAAFGAPLAGVLFAIEELGTAMPTGLRHSTMLCAFGAAIVASIFLRWLDLTRTQRLTLFEVDYREAWAAWEVLPFALLGVVGGLLGGAFVLANEAVQRRRVAARADGRVWWFLPTWLDRALRRHLRIPPGADARVLELVLLAVLTCLSNYPHMLTRMLQNDAIATLFSRCPSVEARAAQHTPLCAAADSDAQQALQKLLLGAAALRFIQTAITIGALTPAGLFVPSLYVGGCVGRALGSALEHAGLAGLAGAKGLEPGVYAMVGAGAMLAGVSRLTVSLVVVLFELTGGLTYVVPFMLAVLIAKWTGDIVTDSRSVYDVHADMHGFTKVQEAEDVCLLNATLQDLCGEVADTEGGGARCTTPSALWLCSGAVLRADLLARCREGAGFVVLSLDLHGEVDVLGWARSAEVMALAGAANSREAVESKAWCRLGPGAWGVRAGVASTAAWNGCCAVSGVPGVPGPDVVGVEDLSGALEGRGVVRVRSDCPLQTALSVFRNRPEVRALVSIGTPPTAHTVTRELFMSRLLHGRLAAFPRRLV